MSATIIPFTPLIAVPPIDSRRGRSRKRARDAAKRAQTFALETRLWKLAAPPTNRVSDTIQLFSFAVFFLAGQMAMVTGLTQSSHLLKSDAIGHVAKRAVDGDVKE